MEELLREALVDQMKIGPKELKVSSARLSFFALNAFPP